MRAWTGIAILGTLFAEAWDSSAHDEIQETVLLAGRTAAGELKVVLDFPQPVELPPSIFRGIPGYATGAVAFHSTILDDSANDLYQLSPDTNFRFVLLAKDPGMEVLDDTGSSYMNVGEMFYVGPSPFDTHPIWNLVDPAQTNAHSLTLKLLDLNGVYPESAPFTIRFSTPRPYSINLAVTDAGHMAISWPTNAAGWELQATDSLAAPSWTSITNAPVVAGTNYSVSLPTMEAQRYFRLWHAH